MNNPDHSLRRTIFRAATLSLAILVVRVGSVPCAAGDDTDTLPAKVASGKSERLKLVIGMSAEQVTELIGAPHRVDKRPNDHGIVAEIWFYEFRVPSGMHEEVLSTRDVPYINPKTGIEEIIKEPVYTQVQEYETETTALVMVDGALTGSKRYRGRTQSY